MNRPHLDALLGSRICHDLISPLGAIGNGVELLAMSGVGETPEVALISDSVDSANARIRFFRVAFGSASPGQRLGASEVTEILAGLFRNTRLSIDWQERGDAERLEVKLAFLLIQCLETAMPWGGRITVSRHGNGLQITGAAERLSLDPALWAHLEDEGGGGELTSASVHFGLAPQAADHLGRRIGVATGPTLITLTI